MRNFEQPTICRAAAGGDKLLRLPCRLDGEAIPLSQENQYAVLYAQMCGERQSTIAGAQSRCSRNKTAPIQHRQCLREEGRQAPVLLFFILCFTVSILFIYSPTFKPQFTDTVFRK